VTTGYQAQENPMSANLIRCCVLALGAMPLSAFTLLGIRDLLSPLSAPLSAPPTANPRADAALQRALAEAKAARPVIADLSRPVWFNEKVTDSSSSKNANLDAALTSWDRCHQLVALAERMPSVNTPPKEALGKWVELVPRNEDGKPEGGPLTALGPEWPKLAERIQDEMKYLNRLVGFEQALEDAREALDKDDLPTCQDLLNRLDKRKDEVKDTRLLEAWVKLKDRFDFCQGYKDVLAIGNRKDQFKELRALLGRFKKAPSAKEERRYEQLVQKEKDLRVAVQIEELEKEPAGPLGPFLERCESIHKLISPDNDGLRQLLALSVQKWLRAHKFPKAKKDSRWKGDEKEAARNHGEGLMVGHFVGYGITKKYWRYSYPDNELCDEYLLIGAPLEAEPKLCLIADCLARYHAKVDSLSANPWQVNAWKDMARSCRTWSEQVGQWKRENKRFWEGNGKGADKKGVPSHLRAPDFDFNQEIDDCDEVASQWDRLGPFINPKR
jgi:hypothetical protein